MKPVRSPLILGAAATPGFLSAGDWRRIVAELKLSRQQARIVSLILQGKQDK